ncbi:hypothetical protein [Burkholderia gladioli]|uniref:hypothetical protein n=1 Tax=Burkholderia gladioli TaxID=28095 RepID=UPI001640315A|nr:hypothetical protein [Burkholderia gladioli]
MTKRTYQTQTPGAAATDQAAAAGELAIVGADTDAVISIGGRNVPLAEIVIGAYETSGMSAEEWAAVDPQVRDDLVGKQRKEVEQAMASATELPSQAAARELAAAAVAARAARRTSARRTRTTRSTPS